MMQKSLRNSTLARATLLVLGLSAVAFAARGSAAELARTAPTPCLDAVMSMHSLEALQQGAVDFVDGVGRGSRLALGWSKGNAQYDKAYSITLNAFQNNQKLVSLLSAINSRSYLEATFRRGTVEEQAFLGAFFKTVEGTVYWTYMLDGATCSGLLEEMARRHVDLAWEQREMAASWRLRLKQSRVEFGSAFGELNGQQKLSFDRAAKLLARFSGKGAADEQEFLLSLIPLKEIEAESTATARSIAAQVLEQVELFKGSAR